MNPPPMPPVELPGPSAEPAPGSDSRPILYTTNYGSGWVSWHEGPPAEKRFMVGYEPFVRALEARPKNTPRKPGSEGNQGRRFFLVATERDGYVHFHRVPRNPAFHEPELPPEAGKVIWSTGCEWVPEDLPVEQFHTDWVRRFGRAAPPYLGGLRHLSVKWFKAGTLVQIQDYEGRETVHPVFEEDAL